MRIFPRYKDLAIKKYGNLAVTCDIPVKNVPVMIVIARGNKV